MRFEFDSRAMTFAVAAELLSQHRLLQNRPDRSGKPMRAERQPFMPYSSR
jgi:hypothetical protein